MSSGSDPAPQPVAALLLEVEGMKCGGCVRAVEQRLLAQPGVHQASVSLLNRTAWVGLDPALVATAEADPADGLIQALAAMGYAAHRRDDQSANTPADRLKQHTWWQQWRQLMVALLLLLVSAAGHLAEMGQLPLPWLAEIRVHALVATLEIGRASWERV